MRTMSACCFTEYAKSPGCAMRLRSHTNSMGIVTQNRKWRTANCREVADFCGKRRRECGRTLKRGRDRRPRRLLNRMWHHDTAHGQKHASEHAAHQITQNDQVFLGM